MKSLRLIGISALLSSLLVTSTPVVAQASAWEPLKGAQALKTFIGGRSFTWDEGPGAAHRGEYRADGTGTLYAWGTVFDRPWEVKGDDQICFSGEPGNFCYTFERNTTDPLLYRVTEVGTGRQAELRESTAGSGSVATGAPGTEPVAGGAAAPSSAELAAKLANPANPIMKIGNNFDFTSYDGDLPGAEEQDSMRYVFLTVFPFKLDNGNSIFFRPGIPLLFNQPVPDGQGGFSEEGTDIGDTGYDLLYSGTSETGTIWGYGLAGTIPTATNDKLGGDLWGLGPEVMLGVAKKWGVFGGVLSHQWDVAGSGSGDIDSTKLNYFYSFPLGGSWRLSAAPTISYNHGASSGNKLTLPVGIGVATTALLGGRPWTFQIQYWNNVERPDAFAAEHTIRFTILPVVSAPWNEDK